MLDSNSLFSESFYLQRYSDVAQAVANGTVKSGLDHFNQFGKFESRSSSAFFDQSFYLSQNADVAQAFQNKTITSAFDHYVTFGQKEGRNGSTIFDDLYYLTHQSDVAAAVKNSTDSLTGIEHFVKFGLQEGRAGSLVFDPNYYLQNNADLKAANFTNQQTADHFVINGQSEGRRASSAFDVQYYLNNNADLKAAGLTYQQSFQHYLTNGLQEARITRSGILPAGSNNGEVTMAIQFLRTDKPAVIGLCNPANSLTNGTNECPIFTEPSAVGTAPSFYPNSGLPQEPAPPWTAAKTNPSITVVNNSNYALTKIVYGNLDPVNQPYFRVSDVTATYTSDIFGSVQYDPVNNTLTLESGDKKGLLPGEKMEIIRHFIVPEDLAGQAVHENNAITFTPA